MTTLEKEVEGNLRDMVKRNGGLCLKWVCPGWSGVPDRIILLPGAKIIFCELKRPKGGRISRLQQWWRDKLRALGFMVLYVYDHDQVEYLEFYIQDELGRK
jgi:hypothetical protein